MALWGQNDEATVWTRVWVTPEFNNAVDMGYRVYKITQMCVALCYNSFSFLHVKLW